MLCFQIINDARGIQVLCDDKGADTLIQAIEEIRASRDHVHLRTPSNGGHQLDEKDPWGKEGVGEVIITWAGE